MRPIGSLMVEHRVIERMLGIFKHELTRVANWGEVDGRVVDVGIDFFSTYVSNFHHRKEEEILFRELNKKPLSTEDRQLIDDLTKEHVLSRDIVEKLRTAQERCATGTKSPDEIIKSLEAMINLHTLHIEKEDKHFFFQAGVYLSVQEQAAMLEEFWGFDGAFVHEIYMGRIREMEKARK